MAASTAQASLVFTATGGGGRSASATFEVVGGNLVVTLANTGTQPTGKWDDTYAVSALFFDYNGAGTLKEAGSAVIGTGGILTSLPSDKTIGSYWAFDTGLTAPGGATDGLRGAGLGLA